MKGFHGEDAALQLDLSHLNPIGNNFLGHEHGICLPFSKQESLSSEIRGFLQISPSLNDMSKAPAVPEERPACRLPDYIYGGLFDPSAGISSLNISMAAPPAGNQISQEKGSCGSLAHKETMSGDGKHEADCVLRAMSDGYLGSEEEDDGESQACKLKGFVSSNEERQMCGNGGREAEYEMRNRGVYMDGLQAPMAALTCEPSSEDRAFWKLLQSSQEKYAMDLVCCDEFCMYEFKVRRCMRGRSHDWTECPFAHPGEKARRRDPRCYSYSGTACPEYRKGVCRKGDLCELSHGVFECWLHPARYRTQPCKDGKACKRRVCFFAHSPSQLRLVNEQLPLGGDGKAGFSDITALKRPSLLKNQVSPPGFFDELGMAAFRTDQIQDASIAMAAQRHSPDRSFENYYRTNRNQLQGVSIDDLLELNSNHDCRYGYFSVADGQRVVNHSAYNGGKGHGYYNCTSQHSSTLDNLHHLKAEANFRNNLALASLKGSFEQLMSPTSTLVGHHIFSPPPLSPPLSPAESPPTSPATAFSTWNCAIPRKMASLAGGHPLSFDAFSRNQTIGTDGLHASPTNHLLNANHGSSVHGPSPLSVICGGDQIRDTDAFGAWQKTINVERESAEIPMEPNSQAQAMADLVSMLKMVAVKGRKRSSPLLQRMQSPKECHGAEGFGAHGPSSPHLMYDSGQGLKSRLNGKLPTEETDGLDLGWVTELVK